MASWPFIVLYISFESLLSLLSGSEPLSTNLYPQLQFDITSNTLILLFDPIISFLKQWWPESHVVLKQWPNLLTPRFYASVNKGKHNMYPLPPPQSVLQPWWTCAHTLQSVSSIPFNILPSIVYCLDTPLNCNASHFVRYILFALLLPDWPAHLYFPAA